MQCSIHVPAALAPVSGMGIAGAGFAGEQRQCETDFAVFPLGHQEDVPLRLTVATGGALLRRFDDKDGHANDDRVIAFLGMCDPSRRQ